MASLLAEALVVGATLGALLLAWWRWVSPLNSPRVVAVAGFCLGAAAHLLFEALGANAWYCKHGVACAPKMVLV